MVNPWKMFVFVAIGTGVTVNVGFLILALRFPSTPVDSHPYERGLEYQVVIDSKKKLTEYGWTIESNIKTDEVIGSVENQASPISFRLNDAAQQAIAVEGLTLNIVSVSDSRQDKTLKFMPSNDGAYCSTGDAPRGRLLLRWSFNARGEIFVISEERTI